MFTMEPLSVQKVRDFFIHFKNATFFVKRNFHKNLAALVKKPDKTDKSVFQSFLMAMIQLRAGAYPPLALPRCTLVFTKQLGFLNRL